MTMDNIQLIDSKYKDDSPINTVNRIKGILKEYGIETIECWNDSGVPYCHSLRVSVFGTDFGVNGKGVTEELALASGYGELMERLQLGRIFKGDQQKDGALYSFCVNDDYISPNELLLNNKKLYSMYAEESEKITGAKITPEEILNQFCDHNGNVPVLSFYCINSKQNEYLPTSLINSVYTTNGCAAGNTMEEAVVQAISEIVERKVSTYIINNDIVVPDIPDDVLRNYKISYEIIKYLKNNGFKVIVKDCSLGKKFPVVCVIIIDEKTGKYHTHYGAYPKFEIALQRTLTESFQNKNLNKVTRIVDFSFNNNKKIDVNDTIVQFVIGSTKRKPEFFTSTEYIQLNNGFQGTTNKELFKECIEYFSELGYDIYVHNYSCFGFPTYQVIIPEYSEVFLHRVNSKYNDLNYYKYAQTVLRNPTASSIKDILLFLQQSSKRRVTAGSFSTQANIPLQLNNNEQQFYMDATMSFIYYTLGRYNDVINCLDRMIEINAYDNIDKLICIKRYLTLVNQKYSIDRIRKFLEYFHNKETVDDIFNAVDNNENLFKNFVLNCDTKCQSSCKVYNYCMKRQTDNLAKIVNTKMEEMDQTLLKSQIEELLN